EYHVYRSTSPLGPFSRVGITDNKLSHIDLPREAVNFYRVTAVNAHGEGPASNIAPILSIVPIPLTDASEGDVFGLQRFLPSEDAAGSSSNPIGSDLPLPAELLNAPRVLPHLGEAGNGTLLFHDDFAVDPETNARWTAYRNAGDAQAEAHYDSAGQRVALTRNAAGRAAAIVANYELTETAWEATFGYQAGPGGDGFTFQFYKDATRYAAEGVGPSPTLGFHTNESGDSTVAGYGIAFHGLPAPRISLVEANITNELAMRPDARTTDGLWHDARVRYKDGHVEVSVDNVLVLNCAVAGPVYPGQAVGFGASTGSTPSSHVIDDFALRRLQPTVNLTSDPEACPPESAPAPSSSSSMNAAPPSFCEIPLLANFVCYPAVLPDLTAISITENTKGAHNQTMVTLRNVGGSDSPSIDVTFTATDSEGTLHYSEAKTLAGIVSGETVSLAYPWTPPRAGQYHLAANVDPDNRVREVDERGNTLRIIRNIPLPLNLPVHQYVLVSRTLTASPEPATLDEVTLQGESLLFHPKGAIAPAEILVHWPWLEATVRQPASPLPWRLVNRADGTYASITNPSQLQGLVPLFEQADAFDGDVFSLGEPNTIKLTSRPMQLRIVETPGISTLEVPVETPNGTSTRTLRQLNLRLGVLFEDGGHAGQTVLFNRAWLEGLGIDNPVFEHADGTAIAHETSDGF
ncbi:MAG TPA: CARDB domain-containing protein, partial [Candidatus Thermoplasmatota archaeon]